jgi:hypothetical protein
MPPISMEGRSVLYVLHITNRKYGSNFESTSTVSGIIDTFYVGETESLGQRLTQHRASWKVCVLNDLKLINATTSTDRYLISNRTVLYVWRLYRSITRVNHVEWRLL